jgi:hypothetical protein
MQKIPTLFRRDYEGDGTARDEVTPGCEWVTRGEGAATRKCDGTACLVRGGALFKRYDCKRYDCKRGKTPPPGFEPCGEPDPTTGHHPGWVPVGDGPEDRWHREAMDLADDCGGLDDGTYELCGPKIQGNPERSADHILIRHGGHHLPDCPRDFAGLREYLLARTMEGVVWHHPDGRMVKLTRAAFAPSERKRKALA